MRARQDKPFDPLLPKLEGLVSEESLLPVGRFLLATDVNHFHVVGVDVNGLVAYHQLSESGEFVVEDVKVRIPNLKLVFPLQQERVLLDSVLVELDKEDSQILVKFVGEHVEMVVLWIKNDLLDRQDIELIVEVDLRFVLKVVVNAICKTGDNDRVLLDVHTEEFWLRGKRLFESVKGGDLLGVEIKLEDAVIPRKDDGVFLRFTFGVVFEVELDAHLLKKADLLQPNSRLKVVKRISRLCLLGIILLKYEKLAMLLFVHH